LNGPDASDIRPTGRRTRFEVLDIDQKEDSRMIGRTKLLHPTVIVAAFLLILSAFVTVTLNLDSALKRPGRFDRIIFVPPPDTEAREEILRILLQDKPCELIDYNTLARKTDRFSGADLQAVVSMAVESKLQLAMKDGIPRPLSSKDLLKAIKKIRPSTEEWFATARNYAIYSNQGGVYDDIIKYLKL